MKQLFSRLSFQGKDNTFSYYFFIRSIDLFNKSFFVLTVSIFFFQFCTAQTVTSGNPGLFGVDGDLYTDTVMNGTFTIAGSHDWFFKSGGTGISVFDTVGRATAYKSISQGLNYNMTKKMQYSRYSTQGGVMLLDATYYRDDINSGSLQDKTVFGGGNKSIMDPTTWTTAPGTSIQSKTDIVDAFVHMRRQSNTNNHLIAYVGGSSFITNGNRYFDFEFYCSRITFDATNGTFSNSGPTATGGHTAFTFNADGSIKSYGDLTLSFSFSSSSVSSIDLYIWTDYTTYSTVNPSGFDFDKSSAGWNGLNSNKGYGYAHIQQKAGTPAALWGMVNASEENATPWGTNSGDIGAPSMNYFSNHYAPGQFAEAAVDLSSFGIDPMMGASSNPCTPPYTRALVKSRASASFTSALSDFVAPMEFLDAPLVSSAIASPAVLSCSNPNVALKPSTFDGNATYNWSTSKGAFASRTDSSSALITKGGTYYLTASYLGCNNYAIDSVVVLQDTSKPVASASSSGTLTSGPSSYAYLTGGDAAASNYSTPFGASQGLLWNWSGPNAFVSSQKDTVTNMPGTYQLTVTEKRNGCKATASTTIVRITSVLALRQIDLQGNYNSSAHSVQLKWRALGDIKPVGFAIQRSSDSLNFVTLAVIDTLDQRSDVYTFTDILPYSNGLYRISALFSNDIVYSNVFAIKNKAANNQEKLSVLQNPVTSQIALNYTANSNGPLEMNLYSNSGKRLVKISSAVQRGNNPLSIPLPGSLTSGVYYLELIHNNERITTQIVKM